MWLKWPQSRPLLYQFELLPKSNHGRLKKYYIVAVNLKTKKNMGLIRCVKHDFNFDFILYLIEEKVIIMSIIQTPCIYISKNQMHRKENYSCLTVEINLTVEIRSKYSHNRFWMTASDRWHQTRSLDCHLLNKEEKTTARYANHKNHVKLCYYWIYGKGLRYPKMIIMLCWKELSSSLPIAK